MSDHDKLLEKSSDCTKEILEVKKNYILKITAKLQDPKTAAKMYWAVLIRLLHNQKFQQCHLYWLMVNLSLIFVKK